MFEFFLAIIAFVTGAIVGAGAVRRDYERDYWERRRELDRIHNAFHQIPDQAGRDS